MTTYAPQEAPANTASSPSAPVASPPRAAEKKRGGWLATLLLLLAAGAATYAGYKWGVPWWQARQQANAPPTKPAARIVPVVAAAVTQDDVQLYLSGLGTITAFNTVTVQSRVDGELIKVHFTEGQEVEQGQLLAEIDPREFEVQLAMAEGQLARDQAISRNAELDLQRYKTLVASKSITQQQLETQEALVAQLVGTLKSDQAQVDSAQLMLSYCKIIAPISGRTGLRGLDQGNMVRANDVRGLAVITQVKPIALTFTIPQDEINRLQSSLSQRPDLTVEIHDRGFREQLAVGKLLAIDNQVDATTGTLKLKAEFANDNNHLFPKQFVNVRLLVDRLENAVLVPAAAVQRGPKSDFVYVVKSDETVEVRAIELGTSQDNWIAIQSGLVAGEIVVTDGVDKLQPNSKVTVELRSVLRSAATDPASEQSTSQVAP